MLNKKELIKKLSQKAGVYESEGKIFFEIFIQYLSGRLNPGEVLKVNDVGYFKYAKGKSKQENDQLYNSGSGIEKIDIMLVNDEIEKLPDINSNNIFIIPRQKTGEEDNLDSHLSLSIGKPLIPISGVIENETFIPKSGPELQQYFNSKAEMLFSSSEKINDYAGEAEIILSEDFLESSSGIEPGESDSVTGQTTDKREQLSTEASEEIKSKAWDFGENISDEVQKNIFSESEEKENESGLEEKQASDSLPWNFGKEFFARRVDYPEQKEEGDQDETEKSTPEEDSIKSDDVDQTESFEQVDDLTDEISDEDIVAEIHSAEAGENEIEEDSSGTEAEDESVSDKYERVKSFIGSKSLDKIDDSEMPFNISDSKPVPFNIETDEEGFTEVKSKSDSYQLSDDEKNKKKKKEKAAFAEDDFDINSFEKDLKQWGERKKSKMIPILILIFSIIIIAGAVYALFIDKTFFEDKPGEIVSTGSRPAAFNIIERNYDIPVSYPYAKLSAPFTIAGFDQSIFSPEKEIEIPKTEIKVVEQEKKAEIIPKEEEPSETTTEFGKVEQNIYKYKDYYVVQVAAFKSYSVAEIEAKRFEDLGYNAFIEIAEVPGKGTWFRLRVGDFTSVQQAKNFESKFSK